MIWQNPPLRLLFFIISCSFLASCQTRGPTLESLELRSNYRIAFGSCVKSEQSAIWKHIKESKPDFMMLLGDNIYLPNNTIDEQALRGLYEARFKSDYALELMKEVPVLAIWDDHDFDLNNSDSTYTRHINARPFFKSFWNNPSPPKNLPESSAFRLDLGKVLLLATDNRTYRLNADKHQIPQVFGEKQIVWLENELRASRHEVIIVAIGSQFLSHNPHPESFSDYERERSRILEAIDASRSRIIILSGDRHYSEILQERIPEADGSVQRIWELTSSPLSAPTESYSRIGAEPRRRALYAETPNFGILDIDLGGDKFSMHVKYFDDRGKPVMSARLD